MKYIMLKTDNILVPIIFPDFMVHSQVAKYMQHMLVRVHEMESEVRSAGNIQMDEVTCHGGSETLNKQFHPKDSDIINTYDYAHGVDDEFMTNFISLTMNKARMEKDLQDDNET